MVKRDFNGFSKVKKKKRAGNEIGYFKLPQILVRQKFMENKPQTNLITHFPHLLHTVALIECLWQKSIFCDKIYMAKTVFMYSVEMERKVRYRKNAC